MVDSPTLKWYPYRTPLGAIGGGNGDRLNTCFNVVYLSVLGKVETVRLRNYPLSLYHSEKTRPSTVLFTLWRSRLQDTRILFFLPPPLLKNSAPNCPIYTMISFTPISYPNPLSASHPSVWREGCHSSNSSGLILQTWGPPLVPWCFFLRPSSLNSQSEFTVKSLPPPTSVPETSNHLDWLRTETVNDKLELGL